MSSLSAAGETCTLLDMAENTITIKVGDFPKVKDFPESVWQRVRVVATHRRIHLKTCFGESLRLWLSKWEQEFPTSDVPKDDVWQRLRLVAQHRGVMLRTCVGEAVRLWLNEWESQVEREKAR